MQATVRGEGERATDRTRAESRYVLRRQSYITCLTKRLRQKLVGTYDDGILINEDSILINSAEGKSYDSLYSYFIIPHISKHVHRT